MVDEATEATASAGPGGEPGAVLFVWATWAVLVVALVSLVFVYGVNVPTWDDFEIVEVSIGAKPLTAGWLWSQHNEHRVPLPRLVLLGLDAVGRHDQCAAMLASVAFLALAAAAVIRAANRMRGGTITSDAALPIVILSSGQYLNLVWGWQVQFTLATSLTLWLIALVASHQGRQLGTGRAWAIGLILTLLPLCGAGGLVMVPFGVAWLMGETLLRAPSAESVEGGSRNRLTASLAAVPSVVILILYVWDYRAVGEHPEAAGWDAVGRTLLQFVSLGLGPGGSPMWGLAGAVVLGMSVLAGAVLAYGAWTRPDERWRDLGLMAMLAGSLALAGLLALGRAGSGERAGLEPRYVTLLLPLMTVVYLAFAAAPRGELARALQMTMFLAACVLVWPNASTAMREAGQRADLLRSLELQLNRGITPAVLIRIYGSALHPSSDELAALLSKLRAAKRRPFDRLGDEEPLRAVALSVEPQACEAVVSEGGGAFRITGVDPHLTFRLDRPTPVVAIRLRYDLHNAEDDRTPGRFVLDWLMPEQDAYDTQNRYGNWTLPTGDNRTTTVYVTDIIREFRIQPDNRPGRFEIQSLELLVPEEPEPRSPGSRPSRGGGSLRSGGPRRR